MEFKLENFLEHGDLPAQRSIHYANFERGFNKVDTCFKADYFGLGKIRPVLIISPTEKNVHNATVIPLKTFRESGVFDFEEYEKVMIRSDRLSLLVYSQVTTIPVTSICISSIGTIKADVYDGFIRKLTGMYLSSPVTEVEAHNDVVANNQSLESSTSVIESIINALKDYNTAEDLRASSGSKVVRLYHIESSVENAKSICLWLQNKKTWKQLSEDLNIPMGSLGRVMKRVGLNKDDFNFLGASFTEENNESDDMDDEYTLTEKEIEIVNKPNFLRLYSDWDMEAMTMAKFSRKLRVPIDALKPLTEKIRNGIDLNQYIQTDPEAIHEKLIERMKQDILIMTPASFMSIYNCSIEAYDKYKEQLL